MGLVTNTKITVGIVAILVIGFAAGFIAFEVLTRQSPDIEREVQIVKPDARRISKSRFVKRAPRPIATPPQEETNIEPFQIETLPIPERVPTAESSDEEIKDFSAWLSLSLEQENIIEETAQEEPSTEDDATDDQINYNREKSRIESVIWEQWKSGLENYNIE